VVRAERQPRWRPAWFIDLERKSEILPLYFRGARVEVADGLRSLVHEMRVFEVLAAHDVPVPRIYGLCPEPHGIVMERSPGRANLATARDPGERRAVLEHYVEILARIHAIDVGAFEAAGLQRPESAQALALADFDEWEQRYRAEKRRPEPAIEFLVGWVRRNIPSAERPLSFICADSGQFLFEHGRVTAVLDLEISCLGDPVADLGGLLSRDLSEPLGELGPAIAHYETTSGAPVPRDVLDFHTVRFALVTPLAVAHLVAAPPPGFDVVQYLAWYLVWMRSALEVVAASQGAALDPPQLTPCDIGAERAAAEGSDFARYRAESAERLEVYRRRLAAMGSECEKQDREEVAALLGREPRGDADAELEDFVRNAGPERDADCLRHLYRRTARHEAILRPVMRELQGVRMQRLA